MPLCKHLYLLFDPLQILIELADNLQKSASILSINIGPLIDIWRLIGFDNIIWEQLRKTLVLDVCFASRK